VAFFHVESRKELSARSRKSKPASSWRISLAQHQKLSLDIERPSPWSGPRQTEQVTKSFMFFMFCMRIMFPMFLMFLMIIGLP
jgi:hypothetical protein